MIFRESKKLWPQCKREEFLGSHPDLENFSPPWMHQVRKPVPEEDLLKGSQFNHVSGGSRAAPSTGLFDLHSTPFINPDSWREKIIHLLQSHQLL